MADLPFIVAFRWTPKVAGCVISRGLCDYLPPPLSRPSSFRDFLLAGRLFRSSQAAFLLLLTELPLFFPPSLFIFFFYVPCLERCPSILSSCGNVVFAFLCPFSCLGCCSFVENHYVWFPHERVMTRSSAPGAVASLFLR